MSRRSPVLTAAIAVALGSSIMTPAITSAQNFVDASNQVDSVRENRKTNRYIIELEQPALAAYDGKYDGLPAPARTEGNRLNLDDGNAQAYLEFLATRQNEAVNEIRQLLGINVAVTRSMRHAINAFVVELSPQQYQRLRSLRLIKEIHPVRIYEPDTDAGPSLIGAPDIWDGLGTAGQTLGEGLVVGIIDSGINHDHPSFAAQGGDGYNHVNPLGSGNYLGYCADVDPSFCNDKLIGAYEFAFDSAPDRPDVVEDPSPEDEDSHGSHTASTVAGNMLMSETYGGTVVDVSGVAPHANIIAYDVCYADDGPGGCPGDALVAAIDQTVADGIVSVINYSISGGTDPYNSAASQAFLNATKAGVLAVASAGNSGPGAATLGHQEPWTMTVGASTHDRVFERDLDITGPGTPPAEVTDIPYVFGSGPVVNSVISGDLIYAGDVGSGNAEGCNAFPAGSFDTDAIALISRGSCDFAVKVNNASDAGAAAVIVHNNAAGQINMGGLEGTPIPAVAVTQADGWAMIDFVQTNASATVTINQQTAGTRQADVMAGFSSRGPNTALDVLKPDVMAPGSSILAAVRTEGAVGGAPTPGLTELGLLSGTSMSSPHAAGAAALLRSLHPNWSPMEVKSALMMTGKKTGNFKEDGTTPTDPFDQGNGRVQVREASEATLIMDETGAAFDAANPELGGDPRTLNLPSLMDSECFPSCTWTRTVTNATDGIASWSVTANAGSGMELEVSPTSFSLAPGRSREITITADTTYATIGDWAFGDVTFEQTSGAAKSPLDISHFSAAVRPIAQTADNASILSKTAPERVGANELFEYVVSAKNRGLSGEINITDPLPAAVEMMSGSLRASVDRGQATGGPNYDSNTRTVSWSGSLEEGKITLTPGTSPLGGYFDLPSENISPITCSSECDEAQITVPNMSPISYNGQTYTSMSIHTNGFIVLGDGPVGAIPFFNQGFPDSSAPNNVIAPFWADLDLNGTSGSDSGAGDIYFANGGPGSYIIQWKDVEKYQQPGTTYDFQVHLTPQGVYFLYADMPTTLGVATIGAEDASGVVGANYYYGGYFGGTSGTPVANGDSLAVDASPAGSVTLTYEVRAAAQTSGAENVATLTDDNDSLTATARTAVAYDAIFVDSF